MIAIAVTRSGTDKVSPELGSAPTPSPTIEAEPPAARAAEPNAEIATRTKDVLTRFVAWSHAHQSAPCPDIAALGDTPRDPWGHPFRLTCTDQPGDEIIGAISAGPDGTPGTPDDIASWQLGRDVTDLVRGIRWVAVVPPQTTPAKIERRPETSIKREAGPLLAKPAETKPAGVKPADGAKPKQANLPKHIELDENGLPINR